MNNFPKFLSAVPYLALDLKIFTSDIESVGGKQDLPDSLAYRFIQKTIVFIF